MTDDRDQLELELDSTDQLELPLDHPDGSPTGLDPESSPTADTSDAAGEGVAQ